MTITNTRLLEGLEQTLNTMSTRIDDPALAEILSSSKIILDELFARENRVAIREHYEAGRAHLARTVEKHDPASRESFRAELAQLPTSLSDTADWSVCERGLTSLLRLTEKFGSSVRTDYGDTNALLAWEANGYRFASRPSQPLSHSNEMMLNPEKVLDFIRGTDQSYEKAELISFRTLPGGFSKQTAILEVDTARLGREAMVMRAEGPVKLLNIKGQEIAREFPLLRYLYAHGILIAEPLWLQKTARPHFLISRRVAGAVRGGGMERLDPMSDQLIDSLASELTKVHTLPLDFDDPDFAASHVGGTKPVSRAEATSRALHEWTDYWRDDVRRVSPTMSRAIEWVFANIPGGDEPPTLVHADCGANNLLVENDRISAILDWEISHLGDPAEDVSWVLFGMTEPRERERFLASYKAASGIDVDAFSIKFYEVVAGLKLVIALFEAQEKYQNAPHIEVKLCKLGLPYLHGPLSKLGQAMEEAEEMKRKRT